MSALENQDDASDWADVEATIAALRKRAEEAEADAARWRALMEYAFGDGDADALPDGVDITHTPSGYNGSDWHRIELAWRAEQWSEASKIDADAAIDAARKETT